MLAAARPSSKLFGVHNIKSSKLPRGEEFNLARWMMKERCWGMSFNTRGYSSEDGEEEIRLHSGQLGSISGRGYIFNQHKSDFGKKGCLGSGEISNEVRRGSFLR